MYAAEGYDTTVAKAFQSATGIPTSVYDAHTGIVVSRIEQIPQPVAEVVKAVHDECEYRGGNQQQMRMRLHVGGAIGNE